MDINCIVDIASREVSFQENYRIAAYDHNVDVIHFSVEPIEDFSLNTSSIKIAAQGPNNVRHDYAVDPSTVSIEEETGYITFDWPIPQGVTEMPIGTFKYGDKGRLIFAVCAEIISGSTVSKAWHSDDGIITVVAHLEPESGGGEDPSETATNAQMIAQLQTDVAVINTQISALGNGSPTPVSTVAEMTDESAVYLYTGSETGYTAGNWYFWNGTAWTSGGVYGGAATDTTLSVSGAAADAKAVGDALAGKADSSDVTAVEGDVSDLKEDFANQTVVYNTILNKYIKSADGTIATYNGWDMTDYIPVMDRMLIYSPERNIYCWWYKSDKSPLSQGILSAGMNEYNPPENAAYIAISNSRSVMGNTHVYSVAYIQNKHSADYAEVLDKGVHFEETMSTTDGTALNTSLYPQGIIADVDYEVKYTNSWGSVRSVYALTFFGEGGVTQQYETLTVFEPKIINVPFDVVKVDVYVASNLTDTGTVTLTIDRCGVSEIEDIKSSLDALNSQIESSISATSTDLTEYGDALIYRKLLPSYYFDLVNANTNNVGEYLSNKANSIRGNGVRFAFYTDSHYPRSVHDAEEIINYIRFRTGIKYVINGGDYIDKYSSKYDAMADMSKCVNPMISAFGHAFLPVLGDHDNNTYGWKTPEELANATMPYTEIDKRLHAGLSPDAVKCDLIDKMETMSFYDPSDHDEWIAYFANNYYVDDVAGKVRYIVCNTGNVDGIQTDTFGLSIPSEVKLVLPWIYDALMGTPSGYSVVYACHRVVSQPNIQYLSSVVCGMLGALKTKKSAYTVSVSSDNANLQEWYQNQSSLTFDFSTAPTIDKIICVSGHAHEDFVVVVNSNDKSSELWDGVSPVSVSTGYVPVIVTQTDSLGSYDDGTTSPHIMTEDTVTEHCIDVIQVEDDNIYITRIGAGNDRTIPIS